MENTLDETKDCRYLDISWTAFIVHRAKSPLSRSLKTRIELGSHFPYLETKRQGQIRDGEDPAWPVPVYSERQPAARRRESCGQWARLQRGLEEDVAGVPGPPSQSDGSKGFPSPRSLRLRTTGACRPGSECALIVCLEPQPCPSCGPTPCGLLPLWLRRGLFPCWCLLWLLGMPTKPLSLLMKVVLLSRLLSSSDGCSPTALGFPLGPNSDFLKAGAVASGHQLTVSVGT